MEKQHNSRRDFLIKVLAGTTSALGTGFRSGFDDKSEPEISSFMLSDRPNVVLVVSDDHGRDALGCYGNPIVKTPTLDRLASEGVQFENAFCTTASCSPSRSVILTGLHNHATGQYGLQHDFHHFSTFDSVKSLPFFLSKAGYKTARAGKFHIAPASVYPFDEVIYDGAANDMESFARSPVELAEMCREFLRNTRDPFFLYFCLDDPHRGLPYDTWPGPNRFGNREKPYPGVNEVRYDPAKFIVPPFLPDTEGTRKELAEYYQAVSRADQGVGRLMEILRSTGKYENTLIIYISDNGLAFPGAKTTLYEPGIQLPCIVRLPRGERKGTVSNSMISWCDITPTILDFAGVSEPKVPFHGRSFKKILLSGDELGWDEVYASHTFHGVTQFYPMRMVRGRKFKLIHNLASALTFPLARDLVAASTWQSIVRAREEYFGKRQLTSFLRRPEYELYDLERDPLETNNLASDSAYSQILNEYRGKLSAFQKSTNDPWTDSSL
jgi:N-sulfoglucosamine sulfohydrolase